ncbi:hypothetical protein KUTeg_007923 [Tegillarca granosa]|uniref:DUF4347 domain-containing protein n=1 Tax=Tegillarca granosa TaxID=220873 RepID=A0ABQ9FEL5_TEGGR|nr:hypothetical protein KUTeg_007923 [Tegillarca granosa]
MVRGESSITTSGLYDSFTKVSVPVYILFPRTKSLSRAAQVSWHWKFLSEEDIVWMPKCLKHGWFLPYTPPSNEFGAWKRHYIGCAQTLDFVSGNDANSKYGTRSAGYTQKAKRSKSGGRSGRLSPSSSRRNMDIRPPWCGPDFKPKDLDLSYRALIHGYNPNDPNIPPSELVLHNKWGIPRRQHEQAVTRSLDFDLGLDSHKRKSGHHIIASGDDYDLKRRAQRTSLSETMALEKMSEKRMKELVDAEWYPQPRTTAKREDLSGGAYLTRTKGKQQLPTGVSQIENPRVIFISSRVPAADLLVDAVNFGVIPLVYEYEGTTAEALALQLDEVLEGRYAQSIGIFCHSIEPGELRLAHGCTVTLETLDVAETREFFESVCGHIVPKTNGGQFDVFVPLAASEAGLEMMIQLSVLTGVQFSSPTGIIGQYNHVNSDWLLDYKEGSPQKMYFCQSKLDVWANTADLAKEALDTCNQVLESFFDKTNRDIAAQLTGQYLLERAGVDDLTFTTQLQKSKVKQDVTDSPARRRRRGKKQQEDVDKEVEKINGHAEHENKDLEEDSEDVLGEEEEEDVMGEEEEEEIRTLRTKHGEEDEEIRTLQAKHREDEEITTLKTKHREEENEEIRDLRVKHGQEIEKAQIERSEKDEQRTLKLRQKQQLREQTDQMRMTFGTLTLTGRYERLSYHQCTEHTDHLHRFTTYI